jgi:hypothetical protein
MGCEHGKDPPQRLLKTAQPSFGIKVGGVDEEVSVVDTALRFSESALFHKLKAELPEGLAESKALRVLEDQ